MKILFEKINENASVPVKAHEFDAGFDLRCVDSFEILPGHTHLVKLGFKTSMDQDVWVGIYSKSGLALNKEVFVLNAPGVIDSGYSGEWGVILHNISQYKTVHFGKGDKVAQAIPHKITPCSFEIGVVSETKRGSGGFGSTGR